MTRSGMGRRGGHHLMPSEPRVPNGGFTKLQIQAAIASGALVDIGPAVALLYPLLALADRYRVDLTTEPVSVSLMTLSRAVGRHRTTIMRWRDELAARGWIRVETSARDGVAARYWIEAPIRDLDRSRSATGRPEPVAQYDPHASHSATPTGRTVRQDRSHDAPLVPSLPDPIDDESDTETTSQSEPESLPNRASIIEAWHTELTGQIVLPPKDSALYAELVNRVNRVPEDEIAPLNRNVLTMLRDEREKRGKCYTLAAVQIQLGSMLTRAIQGDPDVPKTPLWKQVSDVLADSEVWVMSDDLAKAFREAGIAKAVLGDEKQMSRVIEWAKRRWPASDSDMPNRIRILLGAERPKPRELSAQELEDLNADLLPREEAASRFRSLKDALAERHDISQPTRVVGRPQPEVPEEIARFDAMSRQELVDAIDPEIAAGLPEAIGDDELRQWARRAPKEAQA